MDVQTVFLDKCDDEETKIVVSHLSMDVNIDLFIARVIRETSKT